MDLGPQIRSRCASARSILSTLGLENKEGVKVEGKYTVSINLDNPNPLLAKLQPNLYKPIYDSTKCKQVSNADDPWARKFIENNSAGFGPYRLDQLQRGQQAVFKARADYYRGKPAMDTVIFREVPTSATRASLLQGGAVDIAQYLQPLEIIKLRGQKGVAVDSVDASFMIWLELNAQIAPFDNAKVRQAMNFAFPQEQVLKTVFQGLAAPLNGCMPNIYPGFTDKFWKYKYDPDMAKALLKEAGLVVRFQDEPRLQRRRSGAGADRDPLPDRAARHRRRARTEEDPAGDVLQRRVRAQAADDLLRRQSRGARMSATR